MPATVHNSYEDYDIIRDPDGIIAVISRRVSNNTFTIAVFLTYQRDGAEERTVFFSPKYIPAVRRVLDIAEARVKKLEADNPPTRKQYYKASAVVGE